MNVVGEVRLRPGTFVQAVVWLAVLLFVSFGGGERPVRYLIPAGFRGWVLVEYENPACPPLRTEGLWLAVPVRPTGYGCTSSPSQFRAEHFVAYDYVSPDGRRVPIRATFKGGGDGIWDEFYYDKGQNVSGRPLEGFFVGSEQEYDRGLAAEPRPWIFVPPIGPQTP
jgi:hypothetical protein